MNERKVTEDEVRAVLSRPESSRTDHDNGSVVYIATIGRRSVSVAAVFPGTAADPVVVKTVWV